MMDLFLQFCQLGLILLAIWMLTDIAKAVTNLIQAFNEFTDALNITTDAIRKENEDAE